MATHKNIDRICIAMIVFALLFTILFMNGESIGIVKATKAVEYEKRLFDQTKVHTIDIVMNNWESFIETCENEEYETCSVVIDGEAFRNVAIRAKGNTSLSSVSSMNSDRYSFKIEFDHYDNANTYYGLDKLSLNNIIQDNTYMKDYLTYKMMGEFGINAPLCSYVNITVNGEVWGLYLAVEAIEESFLKRNYGTDYGELYKPDSMSFGGGRGNGKGFDMNSFLDDKKGSEEAVADGNPENETNNNPKPPSEAEVFPQRPNRGENGNNPFGGGTPPEMPQNSGGRPDMGNIPEMPEGENPFGGEFPNGFDFSEIPQGEPPENFDMGNLPDIDDFGGEKGGFGMGSDDVKLKYIDDNESSYSNIFDSAKTSVTTADKRRLINALKNLSNKENLSSTVNIEEVIRYFVVHNFVCNGDSYTGSMIHNYYLYEENGMLSMIPWDYNLAFGSFQSADATSTVNSPIDTPVSGGNTDDRPMVDWIFSSEAYTALYHTYFNDLIESIDFEKLISETSALISLYVESDPTKFCTFEEYEKAVETLKTFCLLREESVSGQLNGTIPSTMEGQNTDKTKLIDASSITISDMGTMGMGAGKRPDEINRFDRTNITDENKTKDGTENG